MEAKEAMHCSRRTFAQDMHVRGFGEGIVMSIYNLRSGELYAIEAMPSTRSS